ncbi:MULTISPECIES: helix-turn-helix transcriptional regulator [Novosphingobium]|uniref:DNA-binding transcriptional regulator, CsgD family n=1 Tax=Novosphingobium mathurense TaxID=428990 RepID=A0A1U6H497_9SPHN|nr:MULTISPECIES: helix-turn-helix transcriptional regulator [Novosphingobium]CDO37708.1 putative Transcriptional regulator, LuxR family [Novosphingobium sp. KN65.2]SLJ90644.1 DNA-binding transcriptional regulator, CsgD family [Novosphingobium mathurense]
MGDDGADRAPSPLDVFPSLTPKQHEVLGYVAENRTSKEIAFELGISVSAVNQRIESIRNRTGSPPRAELARAYRTYLLEQEKTAEPEEPAPAFIELAPASKEPDATVDDGEEQVRVPDVDAVIVSGAIAVDPLTPGSLARAASPLPEPSPRSPLAKALIITGGTILVVLVSLGIVLTLHKVM